MGEELNVWGDRGRRERAKGSVKSSEDVTSEGKALAHVHTQTRLPHGTTSDASAMCMLPVAIGLWKTSIFSEKESNKENTRHQSTNKNHQAFILVRTILIAKTELLRIFQTLVGKSQGGCRGAEEG